MLTQIVSERFPRVKLWRRTLAFLIDFLVIWMIGGLFAAILPILPFFILFLAFWLAYRVVLVSRNHGQSLGRYALDVTLVDSRFNSVPQLLILSKREGILGLAAALAAIGLNAISLNPAGILLVIPLVVDCGFAWTEDSRRAFHDRVAKTLVVGSRRGYSLDLKVKRLVAELTRNMK
ncbi:RDD family protein [Aerosakkonemataceae cyanobacterium BLCC-F154]|uniref:RDD family protein n=1 Tax=Floridaenema fluviatile BLCC-F154 TaxID=3153640 RepID=A0ABV4YJQ4_9CYAN